MLEKILPVVLFVILSSDKKVGAVCTSLQNHVLDCYKENRHKSLKCSQLVQAYMDCVEQARKVDTYYGLFKPFHWSQYNFVIRHFCYQCFCVVIANIRFVLFSPYKQTLKQQTEERRLQVSKFNLYDVLKHLL